MNKTDRENEIKDNYFFNLEHPYHLEDFKHYDINSILILDDVLTTGLTSSTIAQTIKKEAPNVKIYLFTLGKTSNPKNGGPKDNSHMDEIII